MSDELRAEIEAPTCDELWKDRPDDDRRVRPPFVCSATGALGYADGSLTCDGICRCPIVVSIP